MVLQHCGELKSVVARFTTHIQTCLAKNQVVVSYEKFSCRKWRVVSLFGTKYVYVVPFTDPRPRGVGGTPLQEANGDVPLDGVANFRIFGVSRDSKREDSRLKYQKVVVC